MLHRTQNFVHTLIDALPHVKLHECRILTFTMSQSQTPPTPPSETDVYAIHGADPEVLAYAMAKYSRSALTMRESLAEISSQRAEQFLNTFYFQ